MILLALACNTPQTKLTPKSDSSEHVRLPATCDAGDAAWVQRTIPLLWGRRPHGAAEVRMWADAVAATDRETVVRAMTLSVEYRDWWREWFTDRLYVARTGDKAYPSCFEQPLLAEHDGALTQFLRSNDPAEAAWPNPFVMADVIDDALVADDVSTIYQTWLFARMSRPVQGANVSAEELEFNRRVNFAEVFLQTYVNRNLDCVPCHNAAFSVTADRTHPLPGHHEDALFGTTTEFEIERLQALFRHDQVDAWSDGVAVWGMDSGCGLVTLPEDFGQDLLDPVNGYFIEAKGRKGSVWDLERDFVAGVDSLAADGIVVDGDAIDGRDAFALLVAANITDQVWESAFGQRLTIATSFSRNAEQAARLTALTETFAKRGFSLQDLLVGVTSDPYYNAGTPETCIAEPYGMDPIVDPWVIDDDDVERQKNGTGDIVSRHDARLLLRTVHHQLGWEPPTEWRMRGKDVDLATALGLFVRESEPGFSGTDFQGMLWFESAFAACAQGDEPDWVDGLLDRAEGHTTREVVQALRDRLLADGRMSEREETLTAKLVGDLDAPAEDLDELGLRYACGAILVSPAYQLRVDAPVGPIPALADGADADCAMLTELVGAVGVDASCDDGSPSFTGTE